MIYVSLDLETTGLNPVENDILEFGAYIENTEEQWTRDVVPCYHVYVWRDIYRCHPVAAAMNAEITRQATMVAYIDDFWLMSVLSVICLGLVFLLRQQPSRATDGGMPLIEVGH